LVDQSLAQAGWAVQDRSGINLQAKQGVAIRYFQMAHGYGEADYLLFVDGKAVGVVEAKPLGHTLTGVEVQADKYAKGLPPTLTAPVRPLPFIYISTGAKTRFYNLLDPAPKSRRVFSFHRPETIAEWLLAPPQERPAPLGLVAEGEGAATATLTGPSTLRSRLQSMPPVELPNLWPNKIKAIKNLETSLRADRPKALIQMATGSGKTLLAVTALYRLIKFGGARRVLFLVDRSNLAEQADKEFAGYRTPDDGRKFSELYNVQRLTSNTIGSSTKVAITTIQRLYSMLKGEPEFDAEEEEVSGFESTGGAMKEPLPVVYNQAYPPEYFDVIFVDECHRSIYSLWRQVLEYFDAFLVGLTATPAAHTFGFFNKNLVMEYGHEEAVADGVNVDFEIYQIITRVTAEGAKVAADVETMLGYRDRQTREVRWEAPDEDLEYDPSELDRRVVTPDQIRTIIRTFRDRLPVDIFPGRTEVPKTLIFAKDDSHAEDIVKIVRDEFGQGNEFCQKITYKTTGAKPRDLIQAFRNQYQPRIAVTVDMIATGTDIKPIEIVMFMRAVRSRVLFEQMKGRGVRVIDPTDLKAVTPDATAKDHFVIVDCVGMCEAGLSDTQPLERKKTVPFKTLLEHVALGGTDPDLLSSLAGRLARMSQRVTQDEERLIEAASGGLGLNDMSRAVVEALDPDRQIEEARRAHDVPPAEEPTGEQVKQARETLIQGATEVLATRPALRTLIRDLKRQQDQIIDDVTVDDALVVGMSEEAREKARELTRSFEQFLADNKDEIGALQFFYSVPHRERLRYADIRELADAIKAPPRSWTPERLWHAYEILEQDKVRRGSGKRLLTDIVSLVRYALHHDAELAPFEDQVHERFDRWLSQQAHAGRTFTPEQARWLEMMRDHVATSVEMTTDDFELAPFAEEGGLGRAGQVFGKELPVLLRELNEALAA